MLVITDVILLHHISLMIVALFIAVIIVISLILLVVLIITNPETFINIHQKKSNFIKGLSGSVVILA